MTVKQSHKATVVPITLEKHPNADSLSIVRVFGSTVCVRTELWVGINKAVFVPPENLIDCSRPEFASFGTGIVKVKAAKLRGVVSCGILVPAKEDWLIGQDVTAELGITHDESDKNDQQISQEGNPPKTVVTKYDIDIFHKKIEHFTGVKVVITEKLHGSQVRVSYDEDGLHVGSRNIWYKKESNNAYWKSVLSCPEVIAYCKDHPNAVVFGEVLGTQGGYGYGYTSNKPKAFFFDVWNNGRFEDYDVFKLMKTLYRVPIVPELYVGEFNMTVAQELSCGNSTLYDVGREGCVVKPLIESKTPEFDRLIMKIIGPDYKG